MKDLIKALRESLKREQERQEALRKHIENGGYYWSYSGDEFDKACDEAEDRLRQALLEAMNARLDELEVRVKALLQKERTEREAERIADSSGMSQVQAWKFVTVDMTPEEEQATADRIRKSREARQRGWKSEPLRTVYVEINGQLCKAEEVEVVLPPEDDVRC
jgi:hypothetical protein